MKQKIIAWDEIIERTEWGFFRPFCLRKGRKHETMQVKFSDQGIFISLK